MSEKEKEKGSAAWPLAKEFEKALFSIKQPSGAKINTVAKLAIKSVKFYKYVVNMVEKFLHKRGKDGGYLVGLYVIDAICKHSKAKFGDEKDPFTPRFAKNLETTFGIIAEAAAEEKEPVIKIVNHWHAKKFFSEENITMMQHMLDIEVTAQSRSKSPSKPPLSPSTPDYGDHPIPSNIHNSTPHMLTSVAQQVFSHFPQAPGMGLPPPAMSIPMQSAVPSYLDAFDFGDDDDAEDRVNQQMKRLEEEKKRLQNVSNQTEPASSTAAASSGPEASSLPSPLHAAGPLSQGPYPPLQQGMPPQPMMYGTPTYGAPPTYGQPTMVPPPGPMHQAPTPFANHEVGRYTVANPPPGPYPPQLQMPVGMPPQGPPMHGYPLQYAPPLPPQGHAPPPGPYGMEASPYSQGMLPPPPNMSAAQPQSMPPGPYLYGAPPGPPIPAGGPNQPWQQPSVSAGRFPPPQENWKEERPHSPNRGSSEKNRRDEPTGDSDRKRKRPSGFGDKKNIRFLTFGYPGFVPSKCQEQVAPDSLRVLSTTLWVSGFPKGTEERAIKELFEPIGKVESMTLMEGSAFVKYRFRKDAEAAKQRLSGTQLNGSALKIGWGRGSGIDKNNFEMRSGESTIPMADFNVLQEALRPDGQELQFEDVAVPSVKYMPPGSGLGSAGGYGYPLDSPESRALQGNTQRRSTRWQDRPAELPSRQTASLEPLPNGKDAPNLYNRQLPEGQMLNQNHNEQPRVRRSRFDSAGPVHAPPPPEGNPQWNQPPPPQGNPQWNQPLPQGNQQWNPALGPSSQVPPVGMRVHPDRLSRFDSNPAPVTQYQQQSTYSYNQHDVVEVVPIDHDAKRSRLG